MSRESMRGTPKTVLLSGASLAIGGAALTLLIPWIVFSGGTSVQSQVFAGPVDIIISLIREIMVPLGTAFVASGIVMGYLKGNLQMTRQFSLEGPSRMLLLWGLGVGLLGVLLIIFVPFITASPWFLVDIAEQSNGIALGVEVIVRITRQVAPLLGAVLLAGAVVIGYARALSRGNSGT